MRSSYGFLGKLPLKYLIFKAIYPTKSKGPKYKIFRSVSSTR